MVTRADVMVQARGQSQLVTAAKARLDSLWFSLGDAVWDIASTKEALAAVFPSLVADFGEAAAVLAAEYFEAQISAPAVLVPPISSDTARAGAWGAIKPGDPTQTLLNVAGVLDRMVLQPGRDTIRESAARARVRWARVPTNPNPCAFCVMLASRGAAYGSEDTADGGRYHDECGCVATPFADGVEYDPSEYLDAYAEAVQLDGTAISTKGTLAAIRRNLGTN